jgi:hypothetical protein
MKSETAALLEKFHLSNRLKFIESDKGLELEHDLSDEEKTHLVSLEYGKTLVGDVDGLFVKIIKNLVKLAAAKAKEEFRDKLSEL